MRWYIVHAYSNFERKVAESIKERAASAGLEEQFEEVLVPMEEVVEMRRGRKIAKVAVARRILTLCFYGLRDGQIRCLSPQGQASPRTVMAGS